MTFVSRKFEKDVAQYNAERKAVRRLLSEIEIDDAFKPPSYIHRCYLRSCVHSYPLGRCSISGQLFRT